MLGLAQFAIRDQDREKKLEFIFSIYDMDRDGFISNGELFQVISRGKDFIYTRKGMLGSRIIIIHLEDSPITIGKFGKSSPLRQDFSKILKL